MRDKSDPSHPLVRRLSGSLSALFSVALRRKIIASAFVSAVFALWPGVGWAEPIGYSGGIWGQGTHDDDLISGSGGMGWIHQGVDWVNLPGEIVFNTYAEYRYRTRKLNRPYYDSQGPAVGMEFKKDFLTIGSDVYWERLPELGRSSTNRELYITWFYEWDFNKENKSGSFALPGSSWGNLTYDVDGLNGSGAQGFVNQGVDWFTLPGGIVTNTYAEYRHRSRTKNNQYYDAGGPAVGLEFKKWFLHLGVDYYWERDPLLNLSSNRTQFYLTWYYTWDLKDLSSPSKDLPLHADETPSDFRKWAENNKNK